MGEIELPIYQELREIFQRGTLLKSRQHFLETLLRKTPETSDPSRSVEWHAHRKWTPLEERRWNAHSDLGKKFEWEVKVAHHKTSLFHIPVYRVV